MDKYRKLWELLKPQTGKVIPLFNAVVKSIEGESCTIELDGLDIDEVRLKATINEEDDYILLSPKVGSMVLVGSLTGDLSDLAVLKVDQVEKLEYKQNGLEILVDSTDGKLQVKNEDISFVDVFQALTNLLKQFKVFTPTGPSGTPLPDTITALTQFETTFKKILK